MALKVTTNFTAQIVTSLHRGSAFAIRTNSTLALAKDKSLSILARYIHLDTGKLPEPINAARQVQAALETWFHVVRGTLVLVSHEVTA